jgi:outer membrane protein assembly factor BamB
MSGSIIYVGADAGYFYAVDMRLKKKLWAYKTEGAIETSAAFDDEAVFFGDSKAVFYSLNAKTGKLNWKTVLDTSVMAAPLLLNDRIFVVTMSGRLFAIDRASGVEIWHTESHERDFGFTVRRASSPVFVNGNIYLGTSSGLIMAFDVRDGSIAWARQIGDRRNQLYDVDSKPLVVGDMLYVSSADGNLACIDPLSGKILWEISAGGASDPILHEGKIYSTEGDTLSCIDPDTGDMLWKQEFDDSGLSSPAGGRHFVTVASTTDRLYLVDSDTGDIMHERYIRKGSFGDPLVIDDTIYVLSNSGRIFTFKIREISSKKKRLVAKTMK